MPDVPPPCQTDFDRDAVDDYDYANMPRAIHHGTCAAAWIRRCVAAEAGAARLWALLYYVEWNGPNPWTAACPWCYETKDAGHSSACALAAALKETPNA